MGYIERVKKLEYDVNHSGKFHTNLRVKANDIFFSDKRIDAEQGWSSTVYLIDSKFGKTCLKLVYTTGFSEQNIPLIIQHHLSQLEMAPKLYGIVDGLELTSVIRKNPCIETNISDKWQDYPDLKGKYIQPSLGILMEYIPDKWKPAGNIALNFESYSLM